MVKKKLEERDRLKAEAKYSKSKKSLSQLEARVEKLLMEEALVVLGQDLLNKLRAIFDSCKEDASSSNDIEFT